MAQRKWTDKDVQKHQKKERWRNFPGTGQRGIEQLLWDRSEDSRLAQRDYTDTTRWQYTPDSSIRLEPSVYINSWIVPPTELVADIFSLGISSGKQNTHVKVHCQPSGRVVVQVCTTHATPSSHRYTWSDPCELPSSDEETDGKPKANVNNKSTSRRQPESSEESCSESTEDEIVAWTVQSEHPTKKLKKHWDEDEDPGAGYCGTSSSLAVGSGASRNKCASTTRHSNRA
jgi:hypothetical protein